MLLLNQINIPPCTPCAHALAEFDTATVQYMGFGRLKNGELLSAAEAAGFDVCAEHVRQLEGESPFHNLMEVK
jgi:hypothetical protein